MTYTPLIKKVSEPNWSSVKKYQDLFVGSYSLLELLHYEFMMALFAPFPGALGIYLRSKFYPFFLRECGRHVFLGKGVTIRVPKRIYLGSNVIIDDNAVLDAKGDPAQSFIRCGDEVEIGRNAILACKVSGSISLGNFVVVGRNTLLSAASRLVIGDNCSIGPYCCLLASGHGWQEPERPVVLQDRELKGITLEDNVWLGAHVTLMDGVTIGRNSIIAAGSVVTHDVPPSRIAAGVPARVVAARDAAPTSTDKLDAVLIDPPPPRPATDTTHSRRPVEEYAASPALFQRVTKAINEALDEVNRQLPKSQRLAKSPDTILFDGVGGASGHLDSLGLLNLMVATEQNIEKEFGIAINLADEQVISQKNSPFRTVDTLITYVISLVEKGCHG